ncbi:hypothetical protein N7467_011156 [Penicillium canescens]|nr:hypothetical protein N7467_011156 [Penicillium canescens]
MAAIQGGMDSVAGSATLCINIRSLVQEEFDNLLIAFQRGGLESVAVFPALGVNIRSVVQEQFGTSLKMVRYTKRQ